MARNVRYYGAGGWRARNEVLRIVRARAANGETCAICGAPFDTAAPRFVTRPDGRRVLAPWSVECDEIVPVSLGGSPTDRENVRPVHRICNQRRGNGARAAGAAPAVHHAANGDQGDRW